ncbi:MAG: hypothetical protein LBL45_13370 [Treponema sp.]|nr:hypothetical protein [Treponema sp.]
MKKPDDAMYSINRAMSIVRGAHSVEWGGRPPPPPTTHTQNKTKIKKKKK